MGTQREAANGTPSAAEPPMRASDGDRDGTVEQLNTAFAEGRLTRSELDERVRSAYAARSWPQLRELTEDLPSAAASLAVGSPASSAVAPAGKPTDLEHLLICALLFLCPPAGICLWIMSRRRAREQLAEPPAGRAIPAAQELPYPARSGPHLP